MVAGTSPSVTSTHDGIRMLRYAPNTVTATANHKAPVEPKASARRTCDRAGPDRSTDQPEDRQTRIHAHQVYFRW